MLDNSFDTDDECPDLPYDPDLLMEVIGQGHRLNRRFSNESTDSEMSQVEQDYRDDQGLLSQDQTGARDEAEASDLDLDLLNFDPDEYVIISASTVEARAFLNIFKKAEVINTELELCSDKTGSALDCTGSALDCTGSALDCPRDNVITVEKKRGYIEKVKATFNRDYISKQAETIRKYTKHLERELARVEEKMVANDFLQQQR